MKKLSVVLIYCVQLIFASGLLAQNAVDTTFDPGSGANAFIESTVVQPDEKILVCGAFTSINGTPRSYIARLHSDGSVDATFIPNLNHWVRFMALQPDKKILVGGFFTGVDGISRNRIARLNEDGSLDATFNPGKGCTGRMVPADPTDPFLFAIALQNDGKIIIGGNFTNYNGVARNGVARLNSDGSLDNTFNVGAGLDSWVRSILILPNEQILLSGWFENYNSRGHNRVVRLNPDGSDDTGFNPQFGFSTAVYSMSRQSDGKIIVGGHSVNTNAPFDQEVVRLLSDGSYDPTFNPGGVGANDKVETVVVQPDGKILIGGYFNNYNNVQVRGFARLNPDGSFDPTLNASVNNWIWTVALQNDGKILMCGAFSTINGISRNAIGRLNPSDDYTPPAPVPPPESAVTNEFETWLLNGTNLTEVVGIPARPETSNTAWHLRVVGTVNTNGQSDFIFQHTNSQIAAWIMDGTNFLEFGILRKSARHWNVIGVGDLNGDQNSDILLQRTNGRLAVLYFKKNKFSGASMLPPKYFLPRVPGTPRTSVSLLVPETWQLVGFDDFDGNGQPDILWKDADDRLLVWLMNKRRVTGSIYLDDGEPLAPGVKPVALGEIDGDQHKDILFQHANGDLALWSMNGTNILSSSELFPGQQLNTGRKFRGLADLNKDARNDFVWQFGP